MLAVRGPLGLNKVKSVFVSLTMEAGDGKKHSLLAWIEPNKNRYLLLKLKYGQNGTNGKLTVKCYAYERTTNFLHA